MKKILLSLFLLGAILLQLVSGIATVAQAATYTDADWEQLIRNYKVSLLGGADVDWSDSEIKKIVGQKNSSGVSTAGISYKGGIAWLDLESNRSNANRVFGSTDIDLEIVTSNTMRKQFVSLYDMARAYGTPGTSYGYKDSSGKLVTVELYLNPTLREAIFYGLEKGSRFYNYDKMMQQNNSVNKSANFNWWDWSFGTPTQILSSLLVLYPFSAEEQKVCDTMTDACLRINDKLRPNNDGITSIRTIAFRRTRLKVCPMIAALTRNTALMEQQRTNLGDFLEPTLGQGDGVKADGSYICHFYHSLEGTYGTEVLGNRIIETYSVFAGTAFELDNPSRYNQFGWIMDTFRPVIHNGVMMAQSCGRYPAYGGRLYGKDAIRATLRLIGVFGAAEDLQLKQFLRSALLVGTEAENKKIYSTCAQELEDVNLVYRLKTILFDEGIPTDDREYATMRYMTDRAVQHRENYTVGLAMSSNRIATPECCNGCNRYGWYTGDGMVYVYNDTTDYLYDQYGEDFQRYANMYRMPGTTEEDSTLRQPKSQRGPYFPGKTYSATTKEEVWTQDYYNDGTEVASFVGGAEMDGKYIAAAMDFQAYSWTQAEADDEKIFCPNDSPVNPRNQVLVSDLTAKKSYFMFDDEIVCVGSDIDFSTRNNGVNTYVDNRELQEKITENGTTVYGTEDILVDGVLLDKTDKFQEPLSYTDPTWVYQENFGGYYFPTGGQVFVNKTLRSSSRDGDDTNDDFNRYALNLTAMNRTRSFFELWISHGKKPTDGSYSYVMLPEKSAEETQRYTADPDVKILKCSKELHVVKEEALGITAMVFWKAGSYGEITVSEPMIVMVREENGKYTISASDPTHNLSTGIITVNRALSTLSADAEIVVSGTDKTVLTVSFDKCYDKGKTVTAEFSEQNPDGLFFSFSEGSKYLNNSYGFTDFTNVSKWARRNSPATASIRSGYLTLPLAAAADPDSGAWVTALQPSDSPKNFALPQEIVKANILNYDPSKAEIFEIRFSLTGTEVCGGTPSVSVGYLGEGMQTWSDCTQGSASDRDSISAEIHEAFLPGGSASGRPLTLTIPLDGSKLSAYERIKGLCVRFCNLKGGSAKIDYIYLGPRTEFLYFGFDATGSSTRYEHAAYGGYNYDAEEGANWATNLTNEAGRFFTVDNEEGTLSLYVGEQYNGASAAGEDFGAYLETSAISGSYPWVEYPERHALSFDPSGSEIVEVRFRTENMMQAESHLPQLVVHYSSENGEILKRYGKPYAPFTLKNGEYQTVRILLDETFTQAEVIKSLGVRFRYIKGGGEGDLGKITVDYIYVGPERDAPSNLFFDFRNRAGDQERYEITNYNHLNFDVGSWARSARTSDPVYNEDGEGTASLRVKKDAARGALYLQTGSHLQEDLPLRYIPENAEVLQMRFKLENFTNFGIPYVGLYAYNYRKSYCNGKDTLFSVSGEKAVIPEQYLTNGEYLTVTLPVSDDFRACERITALRFNLSNLCSISDADLGLITIDYIYVGSVEDLPIPRYSVTFVGAEGEVLLTQAVHHGDTAVYTGSTPTKTYDGSYHYSFKAWDKALTNIVANTTITATFTATAHSYSFAKVDTSTHKASCTCGYSKNEAHSFTYKATTNPSTTATGILTGTCSKCAQNAAVTLPKLNTTDYTKTIVTAPTCTVRGTDKYTWKTTTYGSFSFHADTAALGHSYTTKVTAPTCTGQGYTTHTCSRCSNSYEDTFVAAKGHTEVIDKAIAATCTAAGKTEGKHCSVCNAVLAAQQTVPAKGHTEVTDKAVAATCTTAGKVEGKHCDLCNTVLIPQEVIAATGHSYIHAKYDEFSHLSICTKCNYGEKTTHSYTDGSCVCGEKEIKEPVELPTLKLGHTLNLASDISVNFVILKQNLEGFDPDSVYVECVLDTYEGNEKTGTQTVRLEPVDKGIHYYFTLTGLTAIQMNDSIATTLYGTKDGQVYISPVDTYSIATYAYSQMNNPDRAQSLKILCADLLRYGSAAQIFKSYRTDAYADSNMTEVHKSYLSDMESVTFGNTNAVLDDLPNAPITWAGKSLNLESKVALKFVFHPANYTGDLSALTLRISYTDAYGNAKTATAAHPVLYNAQLGYYVFTVDSLLAAELRAVVSVQIYAGNTPASATLQYSPDTYGNGKTGTLLDLCKALFAYSDSAKAYFIG